MPLNPLEQLGREIAGEHANGPTEAWEIETFFELTVSGALELENDQENSDEGE